MVDSHRFPGGSIAAGVLVSLLVGSLIVVSTHAQRRSVARPRHTSDQFGALSSLHMLDAQIGWAMTDTNRILRTTDGGVHWKNVTPTSPPRLPRQHVAADFLTASSAWVAVSGSATTGQGDTRARKQPSSVWTGASGANATTLVIFRTTDAGQTWQQTTVQASAGIVTQVDFVTVQDGWLLSKHPVSESTETLELFRTTDGGRTWVKIARALASSLDVPPPGQLPFSGRKVGVSFLNARTGWVTGTVPANGYPLLYRTGDGGSTWYRQSLPLSPTEASSQLSILPPLFFNVTDGILPVSFEAGNAANLDVYVTHDGGSTWTGTRPLTASASTIEFLDRDHGWASDGTLLYETGDGGQQWRKLAPGGSFQHVKELDFVSQDIGWAIGATASNVPTLLKTVDGGQGWMVIPFTIS